jgi:16S rRNA (cytosine1402-N4)-methyltransferase
MLRQEVAQTTHTPVLLKEVIEFLNPKPGSLILDCTIGAAGHAKHILKQIVPGGKLIGIDRDENILGIAKQNLKGFEGNFFLFKTNFINLDCVLNSLRIEMVDGILFDLGLSSLQIEDAQRGFSFLSEGPLDMRMDQKEDFSAFTIVNKWTKDQIANLLFRYGQERFSRKIAEKIVRERKKRPIKTTTELSNIVCGVIRRTGRIHPATRTFQAIRIQVNEELYNLENALHKAVHRLSEKGRLCAISFHSLEDRIVKNIFRDYKRQGIVDVLTLKPIRPQPAEVKINARSRSALLRVAEKRG